MMLADPSKSEPVNDVGANEPETGVQPNRIRRWSEADRHLIRGDQRPAERGDPEHGHGIHPTRSMTTKSTP